MEYYFKKLEENGKEFYREMYSSIITRKEKVNTPYGMSVNEVPEVMQAIEYDHPDIFFVDFQNFEYIDFKDRLTVFPKYVYTRKETADIQNRIKQKVNDILSAISSDKSVRTVYEKCLWLHDYMCSNCFYDSEAANEATSSPYAYSIEGFFLHGKSVCLGIALSYRLLCRKLGIECILAKGFSLQPYQTDYESHAWNIVISNDAAAQIDVTWDMCLSDTDNGIHYDYFFLPDIDMMRDHQYVDYPVCRKLKSSYYERNNLCFSNIGDAKHLIDCQVTKIKKKQHVVFQFRLTSKESDADVVTDKFIDEITKKSHADFNYRTFVNKTQNVFFIAINTR